VSPRLLLFADTETTVDPSQRLTFGSSRLATCTGERLAEHLFCADTLPTADQATLQEYACSHVEDVDPLHRRRLRVLTQRDYLRTVFWPVALRARGLVVGFNLPFDLTRVSYGWGAARGMFYGGGFSLPLARVHAAAHIPPPTTAPTTMLRTHPSTRPSVQTETENHFRPRIAIKSLDSKRALMGFTRYHRPDRVDLIPEGSADGTPDSAYHFRGHFLDLRTLAFALTNRGHSLRSACKAFGVPRDESKGRAKQHGLITPGYIGYNRQDVGATQALFGKLRAEFERHPIDLPITEAYSPASIGKAYLEAMGIRPILERQSEFPKRVLGYAMAAYFGGRAECRIRGVPVPVVYLDFLSMYPTVCSLLGIWRLLTCERIRVEEGSEVTAEVEALLASITPERCLDPANWQQFVGQVQLVPDGDILAARAHYGGEAAWQIGVNPLSSIEPLWYSIPDAIASTLLTGKPPRVVRALRLIPEGQAEGLRPVKLRGQVPVDPCTQDFFRAVIEERHRLKTRTDLSEEERKRLDAFLKVLANATAYGIFAEMNRQDLPSGERRQVEVWGAWDAPFTCAVSAPEEPGAYCFPPIAACITGAARLLLALLERSVTDLGGTYAMGDTDSMAIVATRAGGLVPCPGGPHRLADGQEAVCSLSWAQVQAVQLRLDALNPYDRTAVTDPILKLEPENLDPETHEQRQLWCYALSAKRYALFNCDGEEGDEGDGQPMLRKFSEHGLGHLLCPTDPPDIEDQDEEDTDRKAWMGTLWKGIVTEALGLRFTWPDWLDRPALGRITASSPEMLRPFATWNNSKPYAQQVKPYNFLLAAFVRPFGHPAGVDPAHFHLVAPFEDNPRKWNKLAWRNLYDATGTCYTIAAGASPYAVQGEVQVKTYRDVLDEYRRHPEAKGLAPDGRVCSGATVGLLQRRPVTATYLTHVGKESNRLEEVEAGLVHDADEVYTAYEDPQHAPWQQLVLPVLKQIPVHRLQEQTGMSPSQLKAIRNGHALPHYSNRATLIRIVSTWVREQAPHSATTRVALDDLEACAAYLAAHGV
jgi:hypothetical protein